MEMAEASKKTVKSKKPLIPDEKATMQSLAKTEEPKPMEVKAQAQMQTVPKPEEKAVQTKPAKTEASVAEMKAVKEPMQAPAPKPMEVKAPSQMQTVPKPEEKAVQTKPAKTEAPVAEVKAVKETMTPASKPESQPAKAPEAPKAEARIEVKKEADPSKEFVDGIMVEMALKGASKKRLIKTLAEKYGMDKQRVMFKLKRALITERYAAAHAEAGH